MQRLDGAGKTAFKKIHNLAKEKNIDELNNLVTNGLCVNAFEGIYNNTMLLAKEGDFNSVHFLIDHFART